MKKLVLSVVVTLGVLTTAFAQEAEIEKPAPTKKATIDAFVDNAFKLKDTRAILFTQLDSLENITKDASFSETTKEEVVALRKSADELEKAYAQLGLDVKENSEKAEGAAKQTADCGIKAPKCLKAVNTAKKVMVNLTKGLKEEVVRATKVKSKIEALEETAE